MSPPAAVENQTEVPPGGTETVLVVEDDAAVSQAIRHVLEAKGYTVLLAGNAREALFAAFNEANRAIHLVVADIVMPKVNGREIADWLKVVAPTVKILMTSGHPGEIHEHRYGQYSCNSFIPKPFTSAALARAVREALDD